MNRPKVVILGGGMAGLATAWELSSPALRDRVGPITVYQRGWRLGGKGASSRGRNGRIEEHGLHVLLGYYDATFRVIREVYAELDRARTDPECPILDWTRAFTPTGHVGLADHHQQSWDPFVATFSANDMVPGEPRAEDRPLRPIDVSVRALKLLVDFHRSLAPAPDERGVHLSGSAKPRGGSADITELIRGAGVTALATLLAVMDRASRVVGDPRLQRSAARSLATALDAWRRGIRDAVQADAHSRRTWELIDLVLTNLTGMAADGLLSGSDYSKIDHLDYRQWLANHGAAPETRDSAIVRGMYDLTFAYEDGDRSRPRFSAGLGLQLASRMLFDFKGSIFWRMNAGMGDVVFAPLYQALLARGVVFRFFHRLDELRLGRGDVIEEIRLTRQVELARGRAGYEPLVKVGGIPCWPESPDSTQIAGDAGVDLETHGAPADPGEVVTLRADDDFDVAVLAVSLGMIPHVAGQLIAAKPAWAKMVANVATVGTRSAQLWLSATEGELGWAGPAGVTLSGFSGGFDTWASMTHLLEVEGWPEDGPRSLAYFCSAMPDPDGEEADESVGGLLSRFLDEEVGALWPRGVDAEGFRWDLLWDEKGRRGRARLAGQYWRSNLDPSDRYVQSLPGSGRFRIAPGETGFANLLVAGDWTACGLDAGCIEAATRSGVLAARAMLDSASNVEGAA